jgi:hypothetical protein
MPPDSPILISRSGDPVETLIERAYVNRRIQRDNYAFGAIVAGLVPGESRLITAINVGLDGDFILSEINCAANIANAAQSYSTEVLPLASMMLLDARGGFSDSELPIPAYCSSARFTRKLPWPRLMKLRALLQMRVTNYDAAATYNLRFSFIGLKIIDGGAAQ